MTASEAKQKVLAVYPDARVLTHIKGRRAFKGVVGKGVWLQSKNHLSDDAAWIDAASRLPAPKPIEPAQVEAGDHIVHVHEKVGEGLPPLDYTDEDLAEEIRNASYGVNVAGQLSCRTRQLKASLQRERELVKLLQEARMSFPMMQLIAENYGAREWSIKVDVALKAAATEQVSSR